MALAEMSSVGKISRLSLNAPKQLSSFGVVFKVCGIFISLSESVSFRYENN
jgi:hypothetical protein